MIINRAHDFGFVHIPKCAGSTIRQQLRGMDDFGGRFYRTIDHPKLGPINGNHVPLATLREYFPEAFEALTSVTSYTITRDPMDRFISGMSQYLRDIGHEPGELERHEIAARAKEVIAHMSHISGLPDRLHILFARQVDYVMLDGQRIITHLCAMEELEDLFDILEGQHGLTLIRDKVWNPTVTYRYPALTKMIKGVKDLAKEILPIRAYVTAREIGLRTLTDRGVPKLNETLLAMPEVTTFVADYYILDDVLHADAKGELKVA